MWTIVSDALLGTGEEKPSTDRKTSVSVSRGLCSRHALIRASCAPDSQLGAANTEGRIFSRPPKTVGPILVEILDPAIVVRVCV